jgi:hypothetical protein
MNLFLISLVFYIVVIAANAVLLKITYICPKPQYGSRDPVTGSFRCSEDSALVWASVLPLLNLIPLGYMIRSRIDPNHDMYKKFRLIEAKTSREELERKYDEIITKRHQRMERELGIS